MRVLAVVAHPDDEVLGCGGTLIRHTQQKDAVDVLILGDVCSSRESTEDIPERKRKRMNNQVERAAKLMGIRKTWRMNLVDNRFDRDELLDIVKLVERVAATVKPDIVYTHWAGDLNIDHRLTAEAVMTAFRPEPGRKHVSLYSFFIPSSTEWGNGRSAQAFTPNYFVDISDKLQLKAKALRAYRSELRDYPHTRSLRGIREWAAVWGISVGVRAAEPFILLRQVVTSTDT